MRTFITALILALSSSVFAAQQPPLSLDQCKVEAPYGFPSDKKSSVTKICRKGYVTEHDNNAKIPVWVSYTLMPNNVVGCVKRSNKYATDKSLPRGSAATPKDYAKSGYDMGHQANDGDMGWDVQTEEDSFILSNMAPQLPGFNRGIWKKLEDHVRGWSLSRKHTLLIYVGPVYNRKQDEMIGKGMVTVPHAFYKIIVDTVTNEAMVFLLPHESSDDDLETFMTSIAEVQKETGVTFPMPKGVKFSDDMWDVVFKTAISARRTVCSLK